MTSNGNQNCVPNWYWCWQIQYKTTYFWGLFQSFNSIQFCCEILANLLSFQWLWGGSWDWVWPEGWERRFFTAKNSNSRIWWIRVTLTMLWKRLSSWRWVVKSVFLSEMSERRKSSILGTTKSSPTSCHTASSHFNHKTLEKYQLGTWSHPGGAHPYIWPWLHEGGFTD